MESIQVMQCMFETGYYSDESIRSCFSKFNGDSTQAISCFSSPESDELLLEAGDHTPELRWVPAFRDGETIRVDTRNIINYICDHIENSKPDVCQKRSHTVGMEVDLWIVSFIKQES